MISFINHVLARPMIWLVFVSIVAVSPAIAAEPLNVGYLEQRAAPIHFSRAKGLFSTSVPGGVNWQAFPDNESMLLAIMEGSIDVVYGQSPNAFTRGLADGTRMHAVGIALVQIGGAIEFIVASDEVINDRTEQLQAFMDVTEATNTQWRDTPDVMRPLIAEALGLPQTQSDLALDASQFPLALEQRDDNWMEIRAIQQIEKELDLLLSRGDLEVRDNNHALFITLRFLR